MREIKSETMWAIHGVHGFYTGTWLRRKDAIEQHTTDLGMPWWKCVKNGDIVIRVTIIAAEHRVQADKSGADSTPQETPSK